MAVVVNIIGAGNLGKTLGFLLSQSDEITIGAVCNASLERAVQAIDFIGAGTAVATLNELPPADITLITTPDSLIEKICEQLSQTTHLQRNSIAVHCSGCLTSDVMLALKHKACKLVSVHPMRSFANPLLSIQNYQGTYCALEGDDEAIVVVDSIFKSIGSITYPICKTKKASYHAAAVFSSNYLVTLSQQALSCLEEAGVDKKMAMKVISTIMKSTVGNLENTLSPRDSLTGPIQRGDVLTVQKHLDALQGSKQKELYALLGLATLPIAPLDKSVLQQLVSLFRGV